MRYSKYESEPLPHVYLTDANVNGCPSIMRGRGVPLMLTVYHLVGALQDRYWPGDVRVLFKVGGRVRLEASSFEARSPGPSVLR